jgi:putative transcriptional regulator
MKKASYNRIKLMLVQKKVTSRELAKHLGKTETTISRWCTNDMQPPLEVLYAIALFLEIEVSDLLMPLKELKNI